MENSERLEGNDELFDLMDKLPHRISGFLMDGGGFTYDSTNKTWIVQKKEMGRLIKLNVPHECDDVVKRLKEIMVNVRTVDLEHMEEIRKKMRDTRQPILEEEISQAAWSVRTPFLLGQALYLKALQHVDLTAEERKDPDLAVQKFLGYYEKLRSQDINRMTPDEAEKRREMKEEAGQASKIAGYTVLSRDAVPFMLIRYQCASCPPMPRGPNRGLPDSVDSVLILRSRWNMKVEEQTIRDTIAMRMNSLY